MTIQYHEGNLYKLQHDYYEHIKLECTWVTYSTAYFKLSGDNESLGADYRLDVKSNKLHKWSSKYCSWDTIENTLSEYVEADVWTARRATSCSYSGIDEDLI